MQTHTQHARLNTYHGPKRQLLGNQSGQAPPAWRNGITAPGQSKRPSGSTSTQEGGSKILLSRLPADVTENEVEVGAACDEPHMVTLRKMSTKRSSSREQWAQLRMRSLFTTRKGSRKVWPS